MPQIQIIGPKPEQGEGELVGYGTRILMNGQEVPEVTGIAVNVSVDSLLTVTIQVLATGNFAFDGAADLHVHAVVMPGYMLLESTQSDGTKQYRAVEEPMPEPA